MNASWIIPFIILGAALQTCGAAMNGQLNKSLVNPWLASTVSFALITFFFVSIFLIWPHPLPTTRDLERMPWWAVLGGLVGAVQGVRRADAGESCRRGHIRWHYS